MKNNILGFGIIIVSTLFWAMYLSITGFNLIVTGICALGVLIGVCTQASE